jgi:hypothetical protein
LCGIATGGIGIFRILFNGFSVSKKLKTTVYIKIDVSTIILLSSSG